MSEYRPPLKFRKNLILDDYAFVELEENKKRLRGLSFLRKNKDPFKELVIGIYLIQTSTLFQDPFEEGISEEEYIERMKILELRAIKFDRVTGKVICRPFHKFFNLGETKFYNVNNVDWKNVFILEKLDGSLIIPFTRNNQIVWATKKGTMPELNKYLEHENNKKLYKTYSTLVREWNEKGWTCMFEWTSPCNKIIISYDEQRLTLLSMRNMESGCYMPYKNLVRIAKEFDIPVVKQLVKTIDNEEEFLATLYDRTDIEGCVVISWDGTPLCKIKTKQYSDISRNVNYIDRNPTLPWLACLNETTDDMIPYLVSPTKENMIKFWDELLERLDDLANQLVKDVQRIKEELGTIHDPNKMKREYYETCMKFLKDGQKNTKYICMYLQANACEDLNEESALEIIKNFCKKNIKKVSILEEFVGVSLEDYKSIKI